MATVLVVDDRASSREAARAALDHGGHRVIEVDAGNLALLIARDVHPDVVLADVVMPGMDGYELAHELHDDPDTADIPVLLYTANYHPDEAEPLAAAFGVTRVVPKSADPFELLAAIDEAVHDHPVLAPSGTAVAVEHLRTVNAKLVKKILALDESEARFNAFADICPVGVVFGGPDLHATSVNSRLSDITGTSTADLLGPGWLHHLPPACRDEISKLREPGAAVSSSGATMTADGRTRWLSVVVRHLEDAGDQPTGFVAVIDDVTDLVEAEERRHAEERRRHLDEQRRIAERFESLARLSGAIAHDFNNMLSIVLSFGEFVEEAVGNAINSTLTSSQGASILDDVDQISRAGKRAAHLAHQLLTFGGREVVQPTVVCVNAVVREVQDMIEAAAGQQLGINADLDPRLHNARADAEQLCQTLYNLALNARDATPVGGTLIFRTTNESNPDRCSLPPGDYVHIAVIDTGEGMPPEMVDRAIEPFFTTKAKGQGTGLGLATAYGIVKQAGGDLIIESASGQGATIHIYLPATDEPIHATEPPAATEALGERTILLAEDEDGIREVATRILTGAGYHVISGANGAEALELARHHTGPIDGVLTDVVMPVMTGRELGEALQTVRPDIPILYMSGYAAPLMTEQGLLEPGVTARVDRIVFHDRAAEWHAGEVAGRPSLLAGLAFVVVGLTLTLLDTDADGGFRPAGLLAPTGALVAVVGLLAGIFGLTHPTGQTGPTGMAPQTVIAFLVLALGILACRPDRPGVRVFTSDGLGGTTVRRLLPAVLVVVAVLAAFLAGVGASDNPLRGVRVTIAMTALLVLAYLALLYTGSALDRAGRRQQALAGALNDHQVFSETVLETLLDGVVALDPEGAVLRVTPRWCEITGYQPDAVIGTRPPFPWWPPGVLHEKSTGLAGALQGTGTMEFESQLIRADGVRLDILATTSTVRAADGAVKTMICTVRDITERKRIEVERQQLASQVDLLFTMTHDLMCIAGTDGYLKRVNPAWERLFGHSTATLLGEPYAGFVHPDDLPHVLDLTSAFADGRLTSAELETRFRTLDGTYRWINWCATLLPDGTIYAVGRDVNDRRETSDANARAAAIVEGTDEAIVGKALDGTITSWNPAAERMYGYHADEVVGRSIKVLLRPQERGDYDRILARLALGEKVRDAHSVRIRKDGSEIHLELSICPVRDAAGIVTGEASIARDVTARRRADERFRRLVVNAPVAMVMVDADGLIRLINQETERLFGYAGEELIGRPVELLVPDQLRKGHAVQRSRYLTGPVVRSMGAGQDLYGQRRDGTQFPVEIGLAPLDTEEGMLVSAVIHDITDRKQTQQALAAARDDAVAVAKLRSQFVAMVSHEIRTPMNGVIGLTNLLLDSALDRSQRRYAAAIHTSARALLTIINDVLDFSKIEAGKIALTLTDFDLGDLVEEIVNVAAGASGDKPLEVVGLYPAGLPLTVHGDEGRIRQVLLNLIGNAVKFTEAGEVVMRVELTPSGAGYTFIVTDTGIGIAPADVARLFDPFIQADTTASRQLGGTGLGLAISRQLVELMGGQLELDSRIGHGSRFSFTLPLTVPSGAQAPRKPAQGALSGRRILIVDDNVNSRDLLAEHARSWGMETTAVADADAALSVLAAAAGPAEAFEFAVLDQHMPDCGGLDLAEQILTDPLLPDPTIILLSSGHDEDERVTADAGILHALPKPVGPSAFYNCLVQLLDPETTGAGRADRTSANIEPAGHRRGPDLGPVLLAEDHEVNQMVAMDTLAMLGYTADLARNGIEAIELASTKTYQAILMDCQMPKMDGFDATRELRRREPPGHHTPIIALTAGALTEDRQRCLDAGMDDYLSKPIDPDDLRAALERWTVTAS